MEDNYFKKSLAIIILVLLMVLSFFLLKPLLLSIVTGFILAFIFSPVYNWLYKIIKSKNISSFIICIFLIAIIIIPLWLFTPMLINESIKLYRASQQLDIVTPLKAIFPSLFSSQEFSQQVGSITYSFITKAANSLMNYLSGIVLNFPTIMMEILVIFFTLFYALRDKDKIVNYISTLLPFSKEVEKKMFDSAKDITFSVLYGYVVIGIVQGLIQGAGFFIFGVPNAFILFIIAILFGIFPIVGPAFLGIPVAIFLILSGNPLAAWGVLLCTLIASMSDHFIRPFIVSRRTNLHPAIVLIAMIGGFLLLGILGFILGPLIIAYLIIIIEVYKTKSAPTFFVKENPNR